MDVLSNTPPPSTAIEICTDDGFELDSGLRIVDGDGVMLLGKEAFVWRPWMVGSPLKGQERKPVLNGKDIKGFGGVINAKGQFQVPEEAWGILKVAWPKPDLIIIGTGRSIRPLAPATRNTLQELGIRIEVLDTRNASSQFNLLATERGVQEVAGAFVPIGFGERGRK